MADGWWPKGATRRWCKWLGSGWRGVSLCEGGRAVSYRTESMRLGLLHTPEKNMQPLFFLFYLRRGVEATRRKEGKIMENYGKKKSLVIIFKVSIFKTKKKN